MDRGTWVWWGLPAAVTAAVAVAMYHVAEAAERGSRAGAEPVVAGVLVALPFVALSLLEAVCALWAVTAGSRTVRTRSLWAASVVAGLVVVQVPLVPVWLVHAKERPEPGGTT